VATFAQDAAGFNNNLLIAVECFSNQRPGREFGQAERIFGFRPLLCGRGV